MGNEQSCAFVRNGDYNPSDDVMGCNKFRKDMQFEEDLLFGCDNQCLDRKDDNAGPKTRKRGKNAPPKILLSSYNVRVRGFGSDQTTSAPITPLRNYGASDDFQVYNNHSQDNRIYDRHAQPPPQPIVSEHLRNSTSNYSSGSFNSRVTPHVVAHSASASSSPGSESLREISPLTTSRRDSIIRAQVSSRSTAASFTEGVQAYGGRDPKLTESMVPTPSTVLSAASTPYGYASASQSLYASVESAPQAQALCSPRAVGSPPRTNDRSWYAAQVLRESGSQKRFEETYSAVLDSPCTNRTANDSQSGLQCTGSQLYGSAASSNHSSNAHVLTFKRTIADMPMPRWAPERRDLFLGAIATLADVPYGSVRILEVTQEKRVVSVECACVLCVCVCVFVLCHHHWDNTGRYVYVACT
jgi:hypothetical protein